MRNSDAAVIFANAARDGVSSELRFRRQGASGGPHALSQSAGTPFCMSTLAAEANRLVTPIEADDFLRSVLLAFLWDVRRVPHAPGPRRTHPCPSVHKIHVVYDVFFLDTS